MQQDERIRWYCKSLLATVRLYSLMREHEKEKKNKVMKSKEKNACKLIRISSLFGNK